MNVNQLQSDSIQFTPIHSIKQVLWSRWMKSLKQTKFLRNAPQITPSFRRELEDDPRIQSYVIYG